MTFSPERLAYWYFRLNGFLTIEDFIVHPEQGKQQRTDADIVAIRLSHRKENSGRPMVDDARIADCKTFANIIIAEIKKGRCSLNGPWTAPEKENVQRVLRAIGCVEAQQVDAAAASLYTSGSWQGDIATVRLFALGEEVDQSLLVSEQQQVTWAEIISFLHKRFKTYRNQKASTGTWASDGIRLKRLAEGRAPDVVGIRNLFSLERTDS